MSRQSLTLLQHSGFLLQKCILHSGTKQECVCVLWGEGGRVLSPNPIGLLHISMAYFIFHLATSYFIHTSYSGVCGGGLIVEEITRNI